MKKILLILAGILLTASFAISWTGSDQCAWISRLGTGTTSYTLDGETVTVPFTVFGRSRNLTQGVDYTELYLVEDTDTDTIFDQSELDNKKLLKRRPNLNIDIDNIQLTPRYFVDSSWVTEGSRYFIVSNQKDLNGDEMMDFATMAGLGPDGDGTHADSAIRYFYTGGKRP